MVPEAALTPRCCVQQPGRDWEEEPLCGQPARSPPCGREVRQAAAWVPTLSEVPRSCVHGARRALGSALGRGRSPKAHVSAPLGAVLSARAPPLARSPLLGSVYRLISFVSAGSSQRHLMTLKKQAYHRRKRRRCGVPQSLLLLPGLLRSWKKVLAKGLGIFPPLTRVRVGVTETPGPSFVRVLAGCN